MKQIKPDLAEKYRTVLELRCAGLSFDEIARRTGYAGRQGAKHAYDTALKRWAIESVQQQRIIQSERLDRIFTEAYRAAVRGDLGAIDRCLKIEKRRAELWGLDQPKQHTVTGPDGGPLAVDITSDMGRLLRQQVDEIAARTLPAIDYDPDSDNDDDLLDD